MAQRLVAAQTDFGGGQVDEDANRREDAKVPKTGARLMSNWRHRDTGVLTVRPGRNAICFGGPRAERFRMSAQQELIIQFSTNALLILDTAGNVLASNTSGGYLWTNATVSRINWCVTPDRIVICYPGMRPTLVFWDSVTNAFTFGNLTFRTIGFQVQEPFFRGAAKGVTIMPSALFGTVTLTASAPYFTNAMIGQQISIIGQQATITVVGSATPITTCTAVVATDNSLNQWYAMTIDAGVPIPAKAMFPLNTLLKAITSGHTFEVGGVFYNTGTSWFVNVTLINGTVTQTVSQEEIVSAWGNAPLQSGSGFNVSIVPQSTITWTPEFMNGSNGWPGACFFAHGRLGFCDFPQRPDAILWSAVGVYDVFWVDSAAALNNPAAGVNADAAILQFISGQPHVRNVVEWNGDEFIFTDRGVYYIPLGTGSQPLSPGTTRFSFISDATASTIKPAVTRTALIFSSASNDRVSAIIRTGNLTTPYAEQNLTPFHSALITSPVTIAAGRGDEGFPEQYVYVLNKDGSVVVGRMQEDHSFVGWMPWTGAGNVAWLSQGYLDILFTTLYGGQYVIEDQNSSYFLDHAVKVNSPPANMLAGGKGAFFAFVSGTVRVMDGAIDYGTRKVDANGFLLKNPEDDFSSPTIVAGQIFVPTYSPFMPEAPLGQADMQRQRFRKITRAVASVYNSSGFTVDGHRTIPPFDWGDNPFAQPKLKETTYRFRGLGRAYDPTITLIKDNPGPLTLIEFAIEVTV